MFLNSHSFSRTKLSPAFSTAMLFPFPPFNCTMHIPPQTLPPSPAIFSARGELLPNLTFIHSTPQTGPLTTTHTLIIKPRKKILGSARLARPYVPTELLGNKSIPVPSGQDIAMRTLSPPLKFCHSAAQQIHLLWILNTTLTQPHQWTLP